MKIVLIILILLLIAASYFIYLKSKPVKIIPLTQMLDEEVSKYRRNIPASIAIGVYKDGKIIFRNYENSISEESISRLVPSANY